MMASPQNAQLIAKAKAKKVGIEGRGYVCVLVSIAKLRIHSFELENFRIKIRFTA